MAGNQLILVLHKRTWTMTFIEREKSQPISTDRTDFVVFVVVCCCCFYCYSTFTYSALLLVTFVVYVMNTHTWYTYQSVERYFNRIFFVLFFFLVAKFASPIFQLKSWIFVHFAHNTLMSVGIYTMRLSNYFWLFYCSFKRIESATHRENSHIVLSYYIYIFFFAFVQEDRRTAKRSTMVLGHWHYNEALGNA